MAQNKIDSLIESLEESGATDEEIDQAIEAARAEDTYAQPSKTEPLSDDMIRAQIMNEPDWRKRAALAALLISRNL